MASPLTPAVREGGRTRAWLRRVDLQSIRWPLSTSTPPSLAPHPQLAEDEGDAAAFAPKRLPLSAPLPGARPRGGDSGAGGVSFLEACRIPGVASYAMALFFSKLIAYTFLYWCGAELTTA
jgi:hypothetical protein